MSKQTKPFYPHQVRALAKELSTWQDDVEVAFARCRFEAKRLSRLPVEPTDEERSAFPSGVPGMRNSISREFFDAAWAARRA